MPRCKKCADKCLENPLGLCVRCTIQTNTSSNIQSNTPSMSSNTQTITPSNTPSNTPSTPSNTPDMHLDNIIRDEIYYNSLTEQNIQLMLELEHYKTTIETMRRDYEMGLATLDMEMKQQIKTLKDEYDSQLAEAQEKRLTKRTIKRNETKIRKLEAQIKKKQSENKFSRLSAGKSSVKSKSNE